MTGVAEASDPNATSLLKIRSALKTQDRSLLKIRSLKTQEPLCLKSATASRLVHNILKIFRFFVCCKIPTRQIIVVGILQVTVS